MKWYGGRLAVYDWTLWIVIGLVLLMLSGIPIAVYTDNLTWLWTLIILIIFLS